MKANVLSTLVIALTITSCSGKKSSNPHLVEEGITNTGSFTETVVDPDGSFDTGSGIPDENADYDESTEINDEVEDDFYTQEEGDCYGGTRIVDGETIECNKKRTVRASKAIICKDKPCDEVEGPKRTNSFWNGVKNRFSQIKENIRDRRIERKERRQVQRARRDYERNMRSQTNCGKKPCSQREVVEAQTTEVTQGQTIEVTQGQTTEVTQGQTTEVTQGQTTEVSETQTTEVIEEQTTEVSETQTTEVIEERTTEVSETQTTEVIEEQTTEVDETQTTEVDDKDKKDVVTSEAQEVLTSDSLTGTLEVIPTQRVSTLSAEFEEVRDCMLENPIKVNRNFTLNNVPYVDRRTDRILTAEYVEFQLNEEANFYNFSLGTSLRGNSKDHSITVASELLKDEGIMVERVYAIDQATGDVSDTLLMRSQTEILAILNKAQNSSLGIVDACVLN